MASPSTIWSLIMLVKQENNLVVDNAGQTGDNKYGRQYDFSFLCFSE